MNARHQVSALAFRRALTKAGLALEWDALHAHGVPTPAARRALAQTIRHPAHRRRLLRMLEDSRA